MLRSTSQADVSQTEVPRKEAVRRLCLRLLHLRHNRFFRGFGCPELHNLLRGDFDRRARSKVPAHPRLAVNTDQAPDSGQDEQDVLLDLGDGRVGKCVQQVLRYFLGDLARVCEGPRLPTCRSYLINFSRLRSSSVQCAWISIIVPNILISKVSPGR